MSLGTIETHHTEIDALTLRDAANIMLNSQRAALDAVDRVVVDIDAGAIVMANAIRAKASLVYAAAGSSGLMALADACELSGTFGISPDSIQIHMAGGVPTSGDMPGHTEDDTRLAEAVGQTISSGDAVIILSASGVTPYALAVAKIAKAKLANIIAFTNSPNTALLKMADIPICLETPLEVISGSTRLGAGTAQKVALNLMSSLMGVKLGHVYQGMMVNLVADNAKLVVRAAQIVSHITGVSYADAKIALGKAKGNPKNAILIARGCTLGSAIALLEKHRGHLGPCLESL